MSSIVRGLVVPVAVAAVILTAISCGGSDGATTPATTDLTTTDDQRPETTPGPTTTASAPIDGDVESVDLGRVVVLGEEFLLADFLALGGQAVASTATLDDRFVGIERDTSGIDPLSATDPNFELLASYDPDLIITTTGVVDLVGSTELEAIASTAVVDNSDWERQVRELADVMGVPERADELLARYDEALAAYAPLVPDGLTASVATVYAGDVVAAWVDGPVNIPQALLDLGITLTPGGGELDGESNGRVFLSNELIPSLDGELLVLAQSTGVDGEEASLADVSSQPLWRQLPAVAAGDVITLDRLGYPGVEGRIRILDDVVAAIG